MTTKFEAHQNHQGNLKKFRFLNFIPRDFYSVNLGLRIGLCKSLLCDSNVHSDLGTIGMECLAIFFSSAYDVIICNGRGGMVNTQKALDCEQINNLWL